MTRMTRHGVRLLLAMGLLLSLVWSVATAAESQAADSRDSAIWQAYQRAAWFSSDAGNRLVYKANVDARWIGDTHQFWYRNDVRGTREFILIDADSGTRKPAFDHARLAAALSKALGKEISKDRLPFTDITFANDGKSVTFNFGGRWWQCDLTSYECVKAKMPIPAGPETRPGPPEGRRRGPRESGESPDGKWEVFIRDNNVYVRVRETSEEIQLSTNGEPENSFGNPTWSPDSKFLVAWQTQPGEHKVMYNIESAPRTQLRPQLREYVYELPGDQLDVHTLWLFEIENRKQTKVETDPVDYGGPPGIRWRPDGRRFTYEQTYRAYKRERVVEVDVQTGAFRDVIDERSTTFVYPPVRFLQWLDATNEALWTSERDGWNHLYLVDVETGTVKNQITRGEWVVRGVENVDEKARQIVFTASGREPGRDPYLIQYYRINFDGSGLVCLTPGDGNHRIRFSPDRQFYLDTYSRLDVPPVTELRRTADGSLVCLLEKADVADLLKAGWRFPEPFVAKGRDGKTNIWGAIWRPSTLDPRHKYPVIEDIYAGPQGSFVPKSFAARSGHQALAELGFIVVQIDGMGTANRSKAFHDVTYQNLGDSGFPDRIAWMRAAAAKYPYMDVSRVGIYGMSAGGYNAAHALIAHPEFYKVAVSMSGNHDHRTDKTWWNELWMGYPIGPHYSQQSNIVQARKLQGKLFLIHGELDNNVNPSASTLQLVDALIKADKPFDLLIVPGAGHGFGAYVTRRMWDYFVHNLLGVEPPEYRLKPAADGTCTITVTNHLDKRVAIFWPTPDGQRRKYRELEPGQVIRQRTSLGQTWTAQVDSDTVSRYTVTADWPEWDITQDP